LQYRVYYLTALLVLILTIQIFGQFQPASAALTSEMPPTIFDFENNKLTLAEVGHIVIIKGSIQNTENFSIPFLTIFEVRNATDSSTLAIGIIGGEAAPSSTSNVFVSWTPDRTGTFQIRQFILNSNLGMSGVMPAVSETEIIVVNNSFSSSIHE